jgi:hypothetical protein
MSERSAEEARWQLHALHHAKARNIQAICDEQLALNYHSAAIASTLQSLSSLEEEINQLRQMIIAWGYVDLLEQPRINV